MANAYRVNSPTVINETIEGESVIINLNDGFYYSLDNVGAVIWEAINQETAVVSIVASVTSRFSGDQTAIEKGIDVLIAELKKENLIVPIENGKDAPASENSEKIPYVAPQLNKFGDMQDLLLLDPIHEVDEKGWPHSNPEQKPE